MTSLPAALAPFDRTSRAYHRRWWILAVLCLSLLVIVVDNSILNVAVPTLQRDLHATNSQLQWMVDAYTLVFAGLLLTAGSLGDRFGRRGALQFGMAVFGIGSLASALVHTPTQLIFAFECIHQLQLGHGFRRTAHVPIPGQSIGEITVATVLGC